MVFVALSYEQNLLLFMEPLLKKSSEARRNFSVISSLRHSENLQVHLHQSCYDLYVLIG